MQAPRTFPTEYQESASIGGGVPTSEWVLTDLADSSQLATSQRWMAKAFCILKAHFVAPRRGGMEGRNLEADGRARVAEDRARGAEDRARKEQASQVLVHCCIPNPQRACAEGYL